VPHSSSALAEICVEIFCLKLPRVPGLSCGVCPFFNFLSKDVEKDLNRAGAWLHSFQ